MEPLDAPDRAAAPVAGAFPLAVQRTLVKEVSSAVLSSIALGSDVGPVSDLLLTPVRFDADMIACFCVLTADACLLVPTRRTCCGPWTSWAKGSACRSRTTR